MAPGLLVRIILGLCEESNNKHKGTLGMGACYPSPIEAESGRAGVQSQPRLHETLKTKLKQIERKEGKERKEHQQQRGHPKPKD